MNKSLIVLAECVDIRSGKRFVPGDEFKPAPERRQAERLVRAGCLPAEAVDSAADHGEDPAGIEPTPFSTEMRTEEGERAARAADAAARDNQALAIAQETGATTNDQSDDGLSKNTVAELKDLAAAEDIDLGEAARKDDIVAVIRAARAEK